MSPVLGGWRTAQWEVPPRVMLITDPCFGDERIIDCIARVAECLPRGALAVQLRDLQRAPSSLRLFATQLRLVTRSVGASLVLNADPRLARDIGADGVHLGKGSKVADRVASVAEVRTMLGRRAWISVPAHSDDDVRCAVRNGASAVLVSPIFATRSAGRGANAAFSASGASDALGTAATEKKRGRGVEAMRSARACAGTALHIYALGGVSADNARRCAAAGADGAALIRSLLQCSDPSRAARAIHDAWARG